MERQGRPYKVLTSKAIRRLPLHNNLLRLEDARRNHLELSSLFERIRLFDKSVTYRLEQLSSALDHENAVLAIVASGSLRMELEAEITTQSKVWFPENREAGNGSFSL